MYLQTKERGEGREKKKRYKPILSIEIKTNKGSTESTKNVCFSIATTITGQCLVFFPLILFTDGPSSISLQSQTSKSWQNLKRSTILLPLLKPFRNVKFFHTMRRGTLRTSNLLSANSQELSYTGSNF